MHLPSGCTPLFFPRTDQPSIVQLIMAITDAASTTILNTSITVCRVSSLLIVVDFLRTNHAE